MRKHRISLLMALAVCLVLTGCAKTATDEEAFGFAADPQRAAARMAESRAPETLEEGGLVELEDEAVPLAALPVFLEMPAASGVNTAEENGAVIDYSGLGEGYVMARYASAKGKALRVQVQGPGQLYTYELPDGEWMAFPLSEGSGQYTVTVLENRSGRKYGILVRAELQAELEDAQLPFLRPTENVDYLNAGQTQQKALELTSGAETPLEQARAVYDYVLKFIADDGVEAAGGKSGCEPELDGILTSGMGSCYGRAALMAGMLRSQGIPSKISVGYTGKARHICVGIWTEENGWVDDLVFCDGTQWQWTEPDSGTRPGSGIRYTVKSVF